jgi:hypothetical protein
MLVRHLVSPQIDIPGESGQWMQFRRLNSRRLAECADKRQTDALGRMKALGADGLALLRDAARGAAENPAPVVIANPLDAYDRDLLLRYGVAKWSYEADVTAELSSEDGGLDAKTSEWAATQILKFNGLLPAEQDADLGN